MGTISSPQLAAAKQAAMAAMKSLQAIAPLKSTSTPSACFSH